MRAFQLKIKRLTDFLISSICIVIALPFWLVIIIVIKVTMPGPVLFKQERIGKNFKPFQVLKFRTMKVDKEAEKNFMIEKDLERITPLGCFLRRSKLDETPQLLNIWKGEMSLVGPRPTVRQRVQEFREGQDVRLSMAPGLTGLSQISGNVLLSWPRRIEYDCQYVQNFSLLLDINIILKTIIVVLFGEEKYISQEDLKDNRNPFYDITHKNS